MRRLVLIVPEWLSEQEDSPLRQRLPALQTMAELGELYRISELPPVQTPEALWLGFQPGEVKLQEGPLTVAALGVDPPDRSYHFHLSLMSLVEGQVQAIPYEVAQSDAALVLETAKKLNTPTLTTLVGESKTHGLVWEFLGDFGTTPAAEAAGKTLKEVQPEGEGDTVLRRFIDDSVNLLSELEINERRMDEGLPPLNLLWPWGQGTRTPVPNLVLRRGERARVYSTSLRLEGLTRLAGYTHAERRTLGKGINFRLEQVSEKIEAPQIVVLEMPETLEERHWFTKEIEERVLQPVLDELLTDRGQVSLLAPSFNGLGLGLTVSSRNPAGNQYPFDERSLLENQVAIRDVANAVETTLMPNIGSQTTR